MSKIKISINIYNEEITKINYIEQVPQWWSLGLYNLTPDTQWLILKDTDIVSLKTKHKKYLKSGTNTFYHSLWCKLKNTLTS